VLVDLAVMLADGGRGISGLAVLRNRPELFGPVASTPTAWRVLAGIDAETVMPLTETAQSCSPKVPTLSGRQGSGQPGGMAVTSGAGRVAVSSRWRRSGTATGSSQCGQSPPSPTRRQGRTHSAHHCSPR
jgi:hypothetical protein